MKKYLIVLALPLMLKGDQGIAKPTAPLEHIVTLPVPIPEKYSVQGQRATVILAEPNETEDTISMESIKELAEKQLSADKPFVLAMSQERAKGIMKFYDAKNLNIWIFKNKLYDKKLSKEVEPSLKTSLTKDISGKLPTYVTYYVMYPGSTNLQFVGTLQDLMANNKVGKKLRTILDASYSEDIAKEKKALKELEEQRAKEGIVQSRKMTFILANDLDVPVIIVIPAKNLTSKPQFDAVIKPGAQAEVEIDRYASSDSIYWDPLDTKLKQTAVNIITKLPFNSLRKRLKLLGIPFAHVGKLDSVQEGKQVTIIKGTDKKPEMIYKAPPK